MSMILVADDDIYIREMFNDLLPKGAEVVTVENGRTLVNHYDENRNYCLIITDKDMPQLDGLGAIRKIREFDKNVEIWMMSGDVDVIATERAALEAGANRFYPKPVSVKFLNDIEEFICNCR